MSVVTKSGYVAILGPANAGKSTLLNKILGKKVSIVSNKPNTTRRKVLGVLTDENIQIVFVDAPGFVSGEKASALKQIIKQEGINVEYEADLRLLCLDASELGRKGGLEKILGQVEKQTSKPIDIVLLNKVDKIDKLVLLPLIEKIGQFFQEKFGYQPDIFPLSALKGSGVKQLVELISEKLPTGPFYFSKEDITNLSDEEFIAELVREQLFQRLKQEIPYGTAVYVDGLEEGPKGTVAHAVVVVEKNSQKGIVIGKGGEMLKQIGISSRNSLKKVFGEDIHLKLHVKLKQDWTKSETVIKQLGI